MKIRLRKIFGQAGLPSGNVWLGTYTDGAEARFGVVVSTTG